MQLNNVNIGTGEKMLSGLKGKWVKIPCYPVAVKEESYCMYPLGNWEGAIEL